MNRAQRALESVQIRPGDAIDEARRLLEDPSATDEERAVASWAKGRAHHELDELDSACASFDEGLKIASDAGLAELVAEIRLSLASSRLNAGATGEARRLLDRAEPDLEAPASKGRLLMQRGLVELHSGHFETAVRLFDDAEPRFRGAGEELALTRLLVNRGIVFIMSGDLDRGERDFLEGRRLAERLGQHMLSAGAAQNLGFVASRNGDVPAALGWFNEARAGYEAVGSPRRVMGTLESDLCTVLLSSGLYQEAAAAARRAIAMAAASGNRLTEAEAMLLLARVDLAAGSNTSAEEHALRAAELFRRSQRDPWASMADYIGLQAASRRVSADRTELLHRATEITEQLLANGWVRDSLEVRTFAGRTALDLGLLDEARAQLTQAAETRHSGSSAVRANAWLAAASLELADGSRAEARRALATGMQIVEQHRSSLGSTELRAHASINGAELAELGLRLATEDGDLGEILRWAERWHAGSLGLAPVRPEPNSRLARAMAELRQAHASAIETRTDPFDDDGDEVIAALEREIRDLSREAAGAGIAASAAELDVEELQRRLDGDTLIEYFSIGDDLHRVIVTAETIAVAPLGPLDGVQGRIRTIVSALGRLSFPSTSPTLDRATAAAIEAEAAELDDRLVGSSTLPAGGDLVVVPTGPLQSLPWGVLPSLRDRAVTVAPNGALWAGPPPDPDRGADGEAVLVCGADLPGGEAEIARLRRLYRSPIVLRGAEATVSSVLAAMERADVVHIAAHGSFRSDNPMFSALELADGPLTIYDVESLAQAPSTVVLPACDAGRSTVRHGDELLGTASALLQVGVRTVIAPLTVVPDGEFVPELMVELHRCMRRGLPPSAALAAAREAVRRTDGSPRGATLWSFVAIGVRGRAARPVEGGVHP